MLTLLIFAFISGLVTILAPCIWPLLPVILSSTTTGGHRKPLGITLGIMTSFTIFTLTLSYIVKIIPFDPNILRLFAVFVIGILGLTLIIPPLSAVLEGFVSRLSSRFASTNNQSGFSGGFLLGFSLGIVWAPCAGPILATIATLAATRTLNLQIITVTLAYVLGIGIPLLIFATLGQVLFTKFPLVSRYTGRIQQVFGVIMILTAVAIFTNFDKTIEANLLNAFPSYSHYFTALETNPNVTNELNQIKNPNSGTQLDQTNYGKAPDFVGITNWINSKPLTINELKGKVVLIDFWTYTCINCIRTLPYVTSWYEKYKDQGFVVVGVHTPEFEFEKNTENVISATKQFKINYPVAQDNNYATWNNYQNQYWPAHYLIDANGNIRDFHAGEGDYAQTEAKIQELLKEAGKNITQPISTSEPTLNSEITPETYLGLKRMDRFSSNEQATAGTKNYTLSSQIPTNYFGYSGIWNLSDESATSVSNSSLTLNFRAQKVYLVITSPKNAVIKIYLDGKAIPNVSSGADVKDGILQIDNTNLTSKLYNLVNFQSVENHILRIDFQTPNTSVFAFTFG